MQQKSFFQARLSVRHFVEHQLGIENFTDFCSIGIITSPKIIRNPKKISPNKRRKHMRPRGYEQSTWKLKCPLSQKIYFDERILCKWRGYLTMASHGPRRSCFDSNRTVTAPPPPKANQRARRTACPTLAGTHYSPQLTIFWNNKIMGPHNHNTAGIS